MPMISTEEIRKNQELEQLRKDIVSEKEKVQELLILLRAVLGYTSAPPSVHDVPVKMSVSLIGKIQNTVQRMCPKEYNTFDRAAFLHYLSLSENK